MNDFRKLEVWQLSKELSLSIYKITECFPDSEKFGLAIQMRRASVSIPSNIAEGSGRHTNADFNRFIAMALGSSYELDTQLESAFELKFIPADSYIDLTNKLTSIKKMLYKFSEYLTLNLPNTKIQ